MRPDMDKVLCERPRRGARLKRRRRYRGPFEDAPHFESTSRKRGGSKHLGEHLGPLRRWLVRQVGRHWDDVYADLRSNISPNSAVQMHIWFHAEQYVVRHVVLDGGVPRHAMDEYGRTGRVLQGRWTPVFVCPRTGILRRAPDAPNAPKRARMKRFAKARADGRAKARARKKVRRGRPR